MERSVQCVTDKQIPSFAGLLFFDQWGAPNQQHPEDALSGITRDDSVRHDFLRPAVSYRPRLRYWIPDACVDLDQVYDDISQAGLRGAAGVELLGFYLYGASRGTYVPTDWNKYGWGTPAWKNVLDTAIQAHDDHGLLMDFAMGPNQGQGVPAHENDTGLMWDLVPHYVIVAAGGSFHGTVPGWGAGVLQAVVTGLITNTTTVLDSASFSADGHTQPVITQHTLAERSLEDMTPQVGKNGWLDVDFTPSGPADMSQQQHLVYAVYLIRSGARAQHPPTVVAGPQTTPTDYVHNGSWTVDHFSARGARVMTDFWEKHLLINGTRERLRQVTRCAWEDSIEINPNVYWTPKLPTAFAQRWGYSINKYYPLLFHENSLLDHFSVWFVTDEPDAGHSHVADYRTILTEGYGEYLEALRTWSRTYLNVDWSSQIGYNMAVDMQSLIGKADIPECEDLAFGSNIDAYRQFSSPAYMSGKKIISAEVGAVLGQAYQMTMPQLLQLIHRLLAGGVNAYPNTTWPGYAAFTYAWSDMLGRHQPAWDFIRDHFDYLSRAMYILQQGASKMDVAFYQKRTTYARPVTGYEPEDLLKAGYTYGYLDPETLQGRDTVVQKGVLAPMKQAYKALIVRGSDVLTVQGADMLAKHARSGLRVVFAGEIPSYLGGHHDPAGHAYVNHTLRALRHLDNVHHVPREDGLSEVMESLGIMPRTRIRASAFTTKWWPIWRETADGHAQYAFIYHDGEENSAGTIEFQSTGRPYRYDAWSGAITPMGIYSRQGSTITIHLTLGPHQAVLFGFHSDEQHAFHATATSAGVLDVRQVTGGLRAIVGSSTSGHSEWIRTSDGVIHNVPAVSVAPFSLDNWTLVVEHWDPPTPLANVSADASRWNSTHHLESLVSWQHIPGLEHVSGRGYYETTFQWPPANSTERYSSGAFLSLGIVIHTMTVSVNGHALAPFDILTHARLDITSYLVAGERNTVRVVVSTTLANRLSVIWDSLRTSGAPPTGLFGSDTKPPGNAEYGLVGPVTVITYRKVDLAEDDVTKQPSA
ncbi:hypothetical protein HMPREF1624_08161 [Sporothrix schenckii ATCC 58251]|uniref:Glycosyl hydrolases family 2 sugar binding domain-containing protein n=2 Tax=Sporothrix schenckii TaxID=29908 RepID=U7PKM1_SPOS1|nr:hypothetical protein HMPREF1624_08161 [Sporothrix schenckii ATCC 58251]